MQFIILEMLFVDRLRLSRTMSFDLSPHSPLSVLVHPSTLLEAAKKAKKFVGEVPSGQGASLVRLRTKTSSDSLGDQYVTPPRKASSTPSGSKASTPASESANESPPSSFLGPQHYNS